METLIQDAMSIIILQMIIKKDHCFSSSYIKFTSKTWKNKHYLNVGKYVAAFDDKVEALNRSMTILQKIKKWSIQNQYILKEF